MLSEIFPATKVIAAEILLCTFYYCSLFWERAFFVIVTLLSLQSAMFLLQTGVKL